MLTKRIVPCLDVKDGETVKGVNFVDLRSAGDPVELGAAYAAAGADELVFLDITATIEGRKTFHKMVRDVARQLAIPFTVGGGISSISDVSALLNAGADKVSINSAAVKTPELIDELAREFGNQCIVVAIDTDLIDSEWTVVVHGGRTPTEKKTLAWAREVVERGAGEILLTSMQNDGTKKGFALDITSQVSGSVSVPVIASGGAGKVKDFKEVFEAGKADAALAASIFHFGEVSIEELKLFLKNEGVSVRL